MITYKDMTFCINNNCKKKCNRYLTMHVEQEAEAIGLPISMAEYKCFITDSGESYNTEEAH